MFDLIIMLSRYSFIFCMTAYLWFAIVYIAYEQGGDLGNPYKAIEMQKKIISYFHISGFLILSYNQNTKFLHIETVLFAVVSFMFIKISMILLEKYYENSCPLIWTGTLFLADISFMILERLEPALAHKQLMWFIIGLIGMLILPVVFRFIPRFEILEWAYIIASYGLLICTQIFGVEGGGSKNWLGINLIGVGYVIFQPSEIVKFLFIFYLASVFRKRIGIKSLIISGGLSAGIVLLLVMQKDLGSALIFFMTFMVLLYIGTSNEILFFLGMIASGGAGLIGYELFSHVRVRVAAWQNPWADIEGGGYQIVNALFAITTWGAMGSGLTNGMPYIIPVVESDMIFAAITEEFGGIFGAGVISIFIMLLYRGVRIALDCNRRYYSILAMGVISMISFQAFVIIGGVIKFIPLTGVTLPFVSYGGSSVLVSLMMVGLLQWICVYCQKYGKVDKSIGKYAPIIKHDYEYYDDNVEDIDEEYDNYDDEYDDDYYDEYDGDDDYGYDEE